MAWGRSVSAARKAAEAAVAAARADDAKSTEPATDPEPDTERPPKKGRPLPRQEVRAGDLKSTYRKRQGCEKLPLVAGPHGGTDIWVPVADGIRVLDVVDRENDNVRRVCRYVRDSNRQLQFSQTLIGEGSTEG